MAVRRVLSIGQCNADHAALAAAIRRHFGAEVVPAATANEAFALLDGGGFALVLVNRVLDTDGSSGLDLVRAIASRPAAPPVMLVTNYSEYQEAALAAGAVPGFGKAALHDPATVDRLRPYLGTP
jgi:CheY-like chemotaxis protein